MDYLHSFNNRCKQYFYAVTTYPHVMSEEYTIASKMISPYLDNYEDYDSDEIHILNIPSGGVDLKPYIEKTTPHTLKYYSFETSPAFVTFYQSLSLSTPSPLLCTYHNIPVPDHSIDRIIVLASLHHLQKQERVEFYKECKRLLKRKGRLIIGDVIKGSKQDRWLNEFVNQWNSSGHHGIFFDPNDRNDLESVGFTVNIEIPSYEWNFTNQTEMIDFVIHLFGLDLFEQSHQKTKLIDFVKEFLDYFEHDDGRCGFKWQLMYFISKNKI